MALPFSFKWPRRGTGGGVLPSSEGNWFCSQEAAAVVGVQVIVLPVVSNASVDETTNVCDAKGGSCPVATEFGTSMVTRQVGLLEVAVGPGRMDAGSMGVSQTTLMPPAKSCRETVASLSRRPPLGEMGLALVR